MHFYAQKRWEHFICSVSSTKNSGNHHQKTWATETFLDIGIVIIAVLWEMNLEQISFSLFPRNSIWLSPALSPIAPCPFFLPSWETFPASWLQDTLQVWPVRQSEVCPEGHSCHTTRKLTTGKVSVEEVGAREWWKTATVAPVWTLVPETTQSNRLVWRIPSLPVVLSPVLFHPGTFALLLAVCASVWTLVFWPPLFKFTFIFLFLVWQRAQPSHHTISPGEHFLAGFEK